MIRLELSQAEAAALTHALKHYVSELGFEISNTEKMDMREELKAERVHLNEIIERVTSASGAK